MRRGSWLQLKKLPDQVSCEQNLWGTIVFDTYILEIEI